MANLIYRPMAILALGICLAANLALIAGLAFVVVDLAMRPAYDVRDLALVVFSLTWGYSIWLLVDFIRNIPDIIQDIHG